VLPALVEEFVVEGELGGGVAGALVDGFGTIGAGAAGFAAGFSTGFDFSVVAGADSTGFGATTGVEGFGACVVCAGGCATAGGCTAVCGERFRTDTSDAPMRRVATVSNELATPADIARVPYLG
jgi:hypothetical protein